MVWESLLSAIWCALVAASRLSSSRFPGTEKHRKTHLASFFAAASSHTFCSWIWYAISAKSPFFFSFFGCLYVFISCLFFSCESFPFFVWFTAEALLKNLPWWKLVCGTGGHTAEMLSLVGALNLQRYAPRYYIAAVTDSMSLTRAATLEDHLQKCALSTSSSSQVFSLHFDLAHLQIWIFLLWSYCTHYYIASSALNLYDENENWT